MACERRTNACAKGVRMHATCRVQRATWLVQVVAHLVTKKIRDLAFAYYPARPGRSVFRNQNASPTSKLSLPYRERLVDRTRQTFRYRLQIDTLASCHLRKQGCSDTKSQLRQVLLCDCNQVQYEYDPARSPLAKSSSSTFWQYVGLNLES